VVDSVSALAAVARDESGSSGGRSAVTLSLRSAIRMTVGDLLIVPLDVPPPRAADPEPSS
jgi:hypothetical protein